MKRCIECLKPLGPSVDQSKSKYCSNTCRFHGIALNRVLKMTEAQFEDYDERAAILEFEGGMSRREAEIVAAGIILNTRQFTGMKNSEDRGSGKDMNVRGDGA